MEEIKGMMGEAKTYKPSEGAGEEREEGQGGRELHVERLGDDCVGRVNDCLRYRYIYVCME